MYSFDINIRQIHILIYLYILFLRYEDHPSEVETVDSSDDKKIKLDDKKEKWVLD